MRSLRQLQFVGILGICSWILVSCERTDAVDMKMVDLYVELRIASVEYSDSNEVRIARQNLLREADYTSEQFAKEVEQVRSNPELWVHFQKAVVARLDSLKAPSKAVPTVVHKQKAL